MLIFKFTHFIKITIIAEVLHLISYESDLADPASWGKEVTC